jgi:hypothetical protein
MTSVGLRGARRRFEASATIPARAEDVFAYMDDPLRLVGHMESGSWAMAGGRMSLRMDEGSGRRVGSRMHLGGRVLGLALSVEEVVTERVPPYRKAWETLGAPRLLVMGPYRMGLDIARENRGCLLRVFIDYGIPETLPGRWLARVFAPAYARWCTERMLGDAVRYFDPASGKAHGWRAAR